MIACFASELLAAEKPTREYNALPFAGWLVYPSLFVGFVFDDNIYQTSTNGVAGWGFRIAPSLTAYFDNGKYKTTLYGSADARFYPGVEQSNTGSSPNSVAGRAGFNQLYEAQRDLVFRFQGDYTRQTDVFNSVTVVDRTQTAPDRNTIGLDTSGSISNPFGTTPVVNPNSYNQLTGSAGVQKTFGRSFFFLNTSVAHIAYDNTGTVSNSQTFRDGAIYTVTGKAGYWATPFIYVFAEPSVDWRRYQVGSFDSHGYRIVGGLGSDQIGLFRGEIFAGYQTQHYDVGTLNDASGGVFGARLYYYPTRYLKVGASLDETLGVSTVTTPSSVPAATIFPSPLGTTTRVTTALLEADYALSRQWSASARFGHTRVEYIDSSRLDSAWLAGVRFSYTVWRNMGLTAEYQFTKLDSNALLSSYIRNWVSVGATYKY